MLNIKNNLILLLILGLFSCSSSDKKQEDSKVELNPEDLLESSAFDSEIDGKKTALFTLQNKNGLTVQITNYGARVVSMFVPDKEGHFDDVILGFPGIEAYVAANDRYQGAMVGRFANRIAKGQFVIDGETFDLPQNNNGNTLHGGLKGIHDVVWDAQIEQEDGNQKLVLSYLSPDGEEGFPGNLNINISYSLSDDNELIMEYTAVTDKPTHVNLTHHSYFNLISSRSGKSIADHQLRIYGSHITPVDENLIPTGELMPVEGTPFDFLEPVKIGDRVNDSHPQLQAGNGYDHNWVLDKETSELQKAAEVLEPNSGRIMEVWTTDPGIQFYGGNFMDGGDTGKDGTKHDYRTAFCLEAQHFPDSPNQSDFPSTLLLPGEMLRKMDIYKFSVVP